MKRRVLMFAACLWAGSLYASQNTRPTVSLEAPDSVPRVVNGTLTSHDLGVPLASAISDIAGGTQSPVWIGYAIPSVASKGNDGCCSPDSACVLETGADRYSDSDARGRVLAVFDRLVLLRFERGDVTRVRVIDPGCNIDATGTSVHWLTKVSPGESVAYLQTIALRDNNRALSSGAVAAIAFHADPEADSALEKLIAKDLPEPTREQAAFWTASERGAHGLDVLRKLAREDSEERFRRYLTFCFSIAPDDSAIQELIRMSHDDAAPGVRGQALFWMAQKAGAKVTADIAASIQNDPDTEIKKKAVFALARMPNGEGVAKLIEVARTNRNPAVRKQAVFWLGQSKDPQASKFLEDVLTR